MNNSEGNWGTGYGLNENGTEQNRDDYYAENPSHVDDQYERNYREAEREEEDEIRALYPDQYDASPSESEAESLKRQAEAIRKARDLLEQTKEELDALMKSIEEGDARLRGKEAEIPVATKESLGEQALTAATVNKESIETKPDTKSLDGYIDREGVVHGSLEEYQEAEEGYR